MGIFDKKPNVEKLRVKGNLKGLIKALRYKTDWRIRKAAAEALGDIGDPQVIELRGGKSAIVDVTKYRGLMGVACFDEVHAVREAATRAIVKIGEPALPVLINSLQPSHYQASLIDSDEPIAAWILGEIGDPRAVDALLHALFRGVDTASEALVKIGSAATPKICDSLWARAGRVWYARDRRHGGQLFDILGQIGDQRAVVPLLKYIKYGERENDPAIYPFLREARMALERIVKGKEVELFSAALNDRNWLVQVAAAEELEKTNDPKAVVALRKALTDETDEVREAIEKALRKIQKR